MRENLFRGLTKCNKSWIEGDLSHCNDNVVCISTSEGAFLHVHPETVGEYTGVYDRNKKKIFEHDIVRKFIDGKILIGVVEYSDGAFGVRFSDDSGELLCYWANNCEILTNIHDHPEIMGK